MQATAKQLAFLERLAGVAPAVGMTVKEASVEIDRLLKLQKVVPAVTVVAAGMYRKPDGSIYKVQPTKIDPTRFYAKKLTPIGGERLLEEQPLGTAPAIVNWEFAYEAGAIRTLTPDMKLTVEQAREFGLRYGVCAVCGRTLKDATSVQNGIGPVCEKRLY